MPGKGSDEHGEWVVAEGALGSLTRLRGCTHPFSTASLSLPVRNTASPLALTPGRPRILSFSCVSTGAEEIRRKLSRPRLSPQGTGEFIDIESDDESESTGQMPQRRY